MDWAARRQVLRVYLRNNKWWWKWPFVATTVAVWAGALVLLVAPWDRAGSEEHVDGLPAPTAPDPTPNTGPTDRVTSWSGPDEETEQGRTTGTAIPTVEAPADSILSEAEPATADTDTIDREAEVTVAAEPLESKQGDVAQAVDRQPPSPSTTDPTTTSGQTTTGAPSSASSPATTTAPGSPPTSDTQGPDTSTTTTTTQPAVVETSAPPTTTKATGKPGSTDPADDEDLSDTKNGKVLPGQRADKKKD